MTRRLAVRTAIVIAAGLMATACGATGSPGSGERPATDGTITVPVTTAAPVGITTLDGLRATLEPIATVDHPTAIVTRPGTGALYVNEQGGRVKQVEGGAVALDISDRTDAGGERGLLGLAFSTDGATLYVYYTDNDGRVTIDEYAMDGDRVDAASRRNLLSLEHPRANHNGGQLALGPDGFLYIGTGDGGGGGDPDDNGQNPSTLLGKILRIDPTARTGNKPYGIPAGNPFADGASGAPEVWSFGLRNPWRFSFDRLTEDLWIGDVGQSAWEEIDFLPATADGAGRGANLGWNPMEGSHPYEGGSPPPGSTGPIFEYSHDNGECSVTGGYVYRGTNAAWQGVYVFADYCEGEIRLLLRSASGDVAEGRTGLRIPDADTGSITSFGEDADGEILVLSATGGIFRLVPA